MASALSVDSFATFVHACGQYLKDPDRRFFFPAPVQPLELGKIMAMLETYGTKIVAVTTVRPDLTDDNLYPQTGRTADGLIGLLEQFGFKVIDSAYLADEKIFFVMMLENDTAVRLLRCTWARRCGWPIPGKFLERWKEEGAGLPFIKEGRWAVMARREHRNAADLLRNRFKEAALGSAFRKLEDVEVFDHDVGTDARVRRST